MKNSKGYMAFVHTIFILMTLGFLIPFIMIVSVSVSNEDQILSQGFSLIPREIDFTAYSMLFKNFTALGRSMLLTAFIAVVSPFITCAVTSLMGYVLTKKDYRFQKPLIWFVVLTMIFSGGTIPTYIINTKYLGLQNNIMVYFFLGMCSAWGILLFRTFFKGISPSLMESAYIDGASELQIMWRIVFPMSKPIFAILYFTGMINDWNNFQTSLLYITDDKLITIQYFMQRILNNAQVIKQAYEQLGLQLEVSVPVMTIRYAICVVSLLPVFLLFPHVQKYFSKGIAIGSVKG